MVHKKILKPLLFLATFIFLLLLQLNTVGLSLRNKITLESTLDFSWFSDAIERKLHGYVLGRDFAFTYGPLFQYLYTIPARIFHISSYLSVALSPIVSFVILFFLVAIIAKFFFKDYFQQILYILFLFLIVGLLIANGSDGVRIVGPMVYALILTYSFTKKLRVLKLIVVSLLPTFLGLYSYNLFVTTIITTTIIFLTHIIIHRKHWKSETSLTFIFPLIILFQVIFSFLFTHNLDYIFTSLDSVKNYRYVLELPWTRDRSNILLLFPMLLLLFQFFIYKSETVSEEIKINLVSLSIVSFVGFIGAISRSDAGHLLFGVFPSIISVYTIIFIFSKEYKQLLLISIIFYIFLPFKPIFYNTLSPNNIKEVFKIVKQNPSFFSIYKLPPNYYFSKSEIDQLSSFVKQHQNNIYIYPYDSYILNMENTTFNSFALGIYAYSNSLNEEKTLEAFEKKPPQFIILMLDKQGTLDLDDVPNFTRNPLLAKWMIGHYQVIKTSQKFLILSYDSKKNFSKKFACDGNLLTINPALKDTFSEKIVAVIKPPVYYLGTIRLPYAPYLSSYYLFSKGNSSNAVASLFTNTCLKQSLFNKKTLTITRISPFLGRKKEIKFQTNQFSLKSIRF